MPLVRVQVRNEYGLGQPELYREANREDPKAVLEGVAVAGLVGILRQLGDLAEFAAEVFHGIQEQVMSTSSRSRKLMGRVQRIETAFTSLENAILRQKSHLHFAYTSGTLWHARLENEQNHFIYSDLPQFIMDSYEECRDPPCLHLLDKFDSGGPGSCLKRYSDPTFFSRASAKSGDANGREVSKDRKARRSKKKRTRGRNYLSHRASMSNCSGRTQFASLNGDGQISPGIVSTFDVTMKRDVGEQSISFDSRTGSSYIECVFHPTQSMRPEEQEPKTSSFSSSRLHLNDIFDPASIDECGEVVDDDYSHVLLNAQTGLSSSSVTCDEKIEVVKPIDHHGETAEMLAPNFHGNAQENTGAILQNDQMDFQFGDVDIPTSIPDQKLLDDIESETDNYLSRDSGLQYDQMGFQFHVEDVSKSISGQKLLDDIESEPDSTGGDVRLRNDQMDIRFVEEDMPKLISDRKLLDDIESETDNYMDALNTIESESETDIDCQTTRDVEQPSTYGQATEDRMHGLTTQYPEQPSNFDEATEDRIDGLANQYKEQTLNLGSATDGSSNIEASFDNPLSLNIVISSDKSVSPQFPANEEFVQTVREYSDVDNPFSMELCGVDNILDGLNTQSGVSNLQHSASLEPDSKAPASDMIINSSCESQKFPTESSHVQSVQFWTNGGLLGLEPSKPRDFSLNAASQDDMTRNKDDTTSPNESIVHNGDGDGRSHKLVQNTNSIEQISSKCSTLCHNDEDAISNEKATGNFSPSAVDGESATYCDSSHPSSRFNNEPDRSLRESNAALPNSEQHIAPDSKTMLPAASQRDYEIGSETFGISNRFLVNGFHRKISLVQGDKSESPGSRKISVEPKSRNQRFAYQTFSDRTVKGSFDSGSPLNSPSSSPPLQHMKISFQPANGFKTSKLKLKFPDGSFRQDSSRDILPSFQLVPEPNAPHHNIGSDSDDTFCRSSPYVSDDCVSRHSDSNSEQWESDEDTSPRRENELYDALRRISVTESVSSSAGPDRARNGTCHADYGLQSSFLENCLEPSQSSPSSDLPSLSMLNPLFEQEMRKFSDTGHFLESNSPKEPIPLAPPLPPLQWRAMNSYSDMTIRRQEPVFEAFNHAPDTHNLESSKLPQLKCSLVNRQQNSDEALAFPPKSMLGRQKLNGKKEVNQVAASQGSDETEDFLHQIRTRSFNLRPIVMEKPTATPGPANVKVTAILEKANAIRQAVGSDDGEDDDLWSNT